MAGRGFRRLLWCGAALALQSAGAHAQGRHPDVLAPEAIDWAAVAGDFNPDRAEKVNQLPGFLQQRRAFDATTLPILLPAEGSGISLRNLSFSSFGDAYGMELPQEQSRSDLTIVVTATRSFVAADPGTLDPAGFEPVTIGGRMVMASIEDTESGWTASFALYGALYAIDIDCGQQGAGSPCADGGLARRVLSSFSNVTVGRAGRAELDALRPKTGAGGDGAERRRDPDVVSWNPPEDRRSKRRRHYGDERPDPADPVPVEPPPVHVANPRPETPVVDTPVKAPSVQDRPVDTPADPHQAPPPAGERGGTTKTDGKSSDPFIDWLLRQGASKPAGRVSS